MQTSQTQTAWSCKLAGAAAGVVLVISGSAGLAAELVLEKFGSMNGVELIQLSPDELAVYEDPPLRPIVNWDDRLLFTFPVSDLDHTLRGAWMVCGLLIIYEFRSRQVSVMNRTPAETTSSVLKMPAATEVETAYITTDQSQLLLTPEET